MTNFIYISENELIKFASKKILDEIEEYELLNEMYELRYGSTSVLFDRLLSILNKQYNELHDYILNIGGNYNA